jgi:hypothetical protein
MAIKYIQLLMKVVEWQRQNEHIMAIENEPPDHQLTALQQLRSTNNN